MEILTSLVCAPAGGAGAGWFLGLAKASQGAHYQKQFGPLGLEDALMFIGGCLALAALAVWLMHEEARGRGEKRRPRKGSDAAASASARKAKALARGKRRRVTGEGNAGPRRRRDGHSDPAP